MPCPAPVIQMSKDSVVIKTLTKVVSVLASRLMKNGGGLLSRGPRRKRPTAGLAESLESRQLMTAGFTFNYSTIASNLSPTQRFFGSPRPSDAPFTIIRYGEGRVTGLTELGLGYLSPADLTFKFGSSNVSAPVEVATLSSFDNGLLDGIANQVYTPDANDRSTITLFHRNVPVVEGRIERISLETNPSFTVTSSRSTFFIDRPLGTDTRIYDELLAASKGTRVVPFSLSAFGLQGPWIGVADAEIFTSVGRSLFSATLPNRAPTNVSISPTTIAEDRPVGTVVGTLTSTDPDEWQVFSYSLVGTSTTNPDNSKFRIAGNKLLTNASLDFEQKSSYSIRVQTMDQRGLKFEKQLAISVTNVNERPAGLSLSASSVLENRPVSTDVGILSGVDLDASQTLSYSLVGTATTNPDNARFRIVGNRLQTAAIFDFETKRTYSILVRVQDQGGLFFDKAFTISVMNVNERPTALSLSASSVLENRPVGTDVGILSGVDLDASQTLSYSLVGTATTNPDNARFRIVGNRLQTAAIFDFETKRTYSILVRVQDQAGLFFDKSFTISILDVLNA
jgi:hypothetical protein